MPKSQQDGRVRYLVAIYELSRQNGRVKSVEITHSLDISRAGVHNMLQTLAAEGLIGKRYYGDIVLTEAGRLEAARRYEEYQCVCAMFSRCLQLAPFDARKSALIFLATQPGDMVEQVVHTFACQTGRARANS